MTDFRGHSKAGIRAFILVLFIIIPIFLWRIDINKDISLFIKELWKIPVCLFLTYLGALFPDIDIKSKSQRIVYLFIIILIGLLIYSKYYGWAAGIGFFASLGIIFKHRGFLHTTTAAILLPTPLLLLPLFISFRVKDIGFEFYLAAVFGYLSHLTADGILDIPGMLDQKYFDKLKKRIRKRKTDETPSEERS